MYKEQFSNCNLFSICNVTIFAFYDCICDNYRGFRFKIGNGSDFGYKNNRFVDRFEKVVGFRVLDKLINTCDDNYSRS